MIKIVSPSNKKSQLLHFKRNESWLCIFMSGSFAQYHFQLYHIHSNLIFTLRTIQREFHKNRFFINFCSRFSPAHRTTYPKRFCLIDIQIYPPLCAALLCIKCLAFAYISLVLLLYFILLELTFRSRSFIFSKKQPHFALSTHPLFLMDASPYRLLK